MECGFYSKLNREMLKAFNQRRDWIELCFGKISWLVGKEWTVMWSIVQTGSKSPKLPQPERDRNGIHSACLFDSTILALADISVLIKIFVFQQLVEEPWSYHVTWFISGIPFSEKSQDLHYHKREIYPGYGNFSKSIWVNVIKANERKMWV